jgi:hypothetical protein
MIKLSAHRLVNSNSAPDVKISVTYIAFNMHNVCILEPGLYVAFAYSLNTFTKLDRSPSNPALRKASLQTQDPIES